MKENKKKLNNLVGSETIGVLLVFIGLCFMLSLLTDKFARSANIFSVARSFSFIAIIAIGQTLVIITSGIDLSVGSIFAFSGVILGYSYATLNLPIEICILFGLLTGLICGLVNGLFITVLKLPPFIATLGMLSIARGLAFLVSKGYPIGMPRYFNKLGQGKMGQVPYPVIYVIIIALIFTFILRKTIFGRRIYALGGNEEATKISGINTDKLKLMVYSLSGILAAFAGIVQVARLGTAQSTAGAGYELDAIAAVIIGGASINGGKGRIVNTIIGAALMGVLGNGLTLLSVSDYWRNTIIGIVIVGAVAIDQFRYRRQPA